MLVLILVTGSASAQKSTRLKIATLAPEGSFWMEEARKTAELIAERTDGRVTLRLYPGGTMGSDDAVLRKMRIGQLQGGALLAGALAKLDSSVEIFNLPLLFRSYDEVDHVRKHMDQRLMSVLDDDGLVSFGIVETGFVYLMSSRAIRSLDELKDRKAWMPEGDSVSKAILDALGMSAAPLAISDVMTGLQTGLIDTVAAPPVGAVALQWFTKAKYVTDLPVTYLYGAIVLSKRGFEKIGAEDREVVREALTAMATEMDRRARIDNEQAREALTKQGVTFVDPTPETELRWAEAAAEATRQLIESEEYDRELLGEVDRLLEDHRSRSQLADAGS
jgi:TRAP-type C4-dicarboxylate transport system substrate-binding protein